MEHSGEDSSQVFHVEHCLVSRKSLVAILCDAIRCDSLPLTWEFGPIIQFLTDLKRLSVLLSSHLLLFGDRLLTQLILVV